MTQQTDRIGAVVAPVLAGVGLDCYDVELSGSGRSRTLRILVERPHDERPDRDAPSEQEHGDRPRGVDLDAITAATEALAPVLDHDPVVAAALPGAYLLEVSSPGLERPLRTRAHFRGALGSAVSLKTRNASGAAERRRAVVVAADDEAVEIDVDGIRERVAYADIVQARTVFEWGPAPKSEKGAGRSTKSKPATPARG